MEPQATPSDRLAPSFSPDLEHMVEEPSPQIVGPPAYASPDPATLSGVLVPVEVHPLAEQLSEDYGKTASESFAAIDSPETTLTASLADKPGGRKSQARSENREEWTAAHWKDQATEYGLTTGGKKDEIKDRVEQHEAMIEEAKAYSAEDWKGEIGDAGSADELGELRALYGQAGADFSTVETAFDAKQAEFGGTNDDES